MHATPVAGGHPLLWVMLGIGLFAVVVCGGLLGYRRTADSVRPDVEMEQSYTNSLLPGPAGLHAPRNSDSNLRAVSQHWQIPHLTLSYMHEEVGHDVLVMLHTFALQTSPKADADGTWRAISAA
eukprot:6399669-Amphidinium_carterae.1